MTEDQFLEELKKAGLIDEAATTKLKRETFLSGRRVEELLSERRLVDDIKLAEFKSQLLKVPYRKVDADKLDLKILELVPEETVRTYGVMPLGKQDNLLIVGMLQPDDLKAQEALKFIARKNRLSLGVYLISYSDWQSVLKKYSPYKGQIEAAIRSLDLKTGEGGRKFVSLDDATSAGTEDAPVIKIVSDTLKEAIQNQASDVHIEPQDTHLRIRFRIDGRLQEAATLPVELSQPVVSRVKVVSNLKIDETRIPQDGRFRSKVFNRAVDFRVSTFPTPLGEKVAIRILDQSVGLKTFEQLGLAGKNLNTVKAGLEKPFGMVLISGPTGSGKSTTLYALLQTLNKESVNIVSLEDPVEYFVGGVNQSQVRPEIGYDFASGLRQILRQDPDVIMVGEIRDNETAGLAIHAALTGHIVLSTIHTNNAAGVIPRLIDMKVEPFLLPSALNLMISQRLVSLLCDNCKAKVDAPPPVQKIIKSALSGLPDDISSNYREPYKIYHAPGCDRCRNHGFVGRIAVFEVFEMTPDVETIVNTSPTLERIAAEAKRQGVITMRQDGVLKALAGLISIEEVIRETKEN